MVLRVACCSARRGRRWRRTRVSCPFSPRGIDRLERGLARRAALIGPGLEPTFDDRQQTLKCVGHALHLKPADLMAHPDLEGWGMCLAPPHRRLRDPAIAPRMADTAITAHPKSRRRSVAAADPVGSSPPDQREVLHHRGRGAKPVVVEHLPHAVRSRHDRGRLTRWADAVRHITRRWIPFAERRGLEDMTPGPTAYLAAKAKGDRSMPSKRERSEDADDPVPQGPRDTVRTALFEPQSPAMQAYIPRHSVLRRGHHDRATRTSSLEPSTRWAMGHHPIQGGERGTSVALDTSSTTGMWDRPPRREAQGDGAAVVLRGRESRPHGEGR